MKYNPRYKSYLQETFSFDEQKADEVLDAMHKPIGKSIRINTSKISVENFKVRVQPQGWHLTPTDIPEVFYVDRDDTTTALGATDEHQSGLIYIQEVAASHPPHIMRQIIGSELVTRNLDKNSLVLDMCSSPGGKTTQLAQYFPESLIIANEADKGRLPQLYENLDRMGHTNVCVTNYDGRYYQHFPEMFDAILLDAPCSGEGCAFKTPEALRNWHIKNIRRIAKLQYQLFVTAMYALKPGGVLVYSTCTLNQEENEGVIEKGFSRLHKNSQLVTRNGELVSYLDQKRLWPHETGTGGFFYSAFQKLQALPQDDIRTGGEVIANNNISYLEQRDDGYIYEFKKDRMMCSHDVRELMKNIYFTKIGIGI